MITKKKAISLAVAACMAACTLAGCDALTTRNTAKDYRQVVAEVNIANSEDFKEAGKYYEYAQLFDTPRTIVKRDLVASYVSSGYNLQSQYGWSYADVFDNIMQSLVSRQIYVQYAKLYLTENYEDYTVAGYLTATAGQFPTEEAKNVAGLGYFLSAEERAKADYDLLVSFNSSLDSIEEDIIKLTDEEHDHDFATSVRTTPTGAETVDADYYIDVNDDNASKHYGVWTGNESAAQLGEYEKLDGSTTTTRRKAYNRFLANLSSNQLVQDKENTADFKSLTYFAIERQAAYETALINKLTDTLEDELEAKLTAGWAEEQFNAAYNNQVNTYDEDRSTFESALDGMSDTSFVLYPYKDVREYGFVINILLPFSDLQNQEFGDSSNDLGDENGNKFISRAKSLKAIRATDQRETWFTGETDYSFKATGTEHAYTGEDDGREYLFFENSFEDEAEGTVNEYERLKNYYGAYTYNGKVSANKVDEHYTEYTFTPAKLSIDDFLTEMEAYLGFAGLKITKDGNYAGGSEYFENTDYYYHVDDAAVTEGKAKAGDVNYDKFIYAKGKISSFNGDAVFVESDPYNANEIFLKDSPENTALSVMNELSFAYNTDTAGLNSYLGYSISPYKTNYMSEFEYGAQLAVKEGAGTYVVVPTDYGWHIIYCTMSFVDAADGKTFNYSDADKEKEGTFSYLYFESIKSNAMSSYASGIQSATINAYYDVASKIYRSRYEDLRSLS